MSGIAAAVIGGGASLVGGAISAYGASRAARTQAQAAQQGLDAQERMFQRQVELQEPFRQTGLTAQNQLLTLLGMPGGEAGSAEYGMATRPFGMADFQADPGYAFRLQEGLQALERSAAARGGLMSGATGKALTRYGQEAASQEYMNAFNRYQAERAARLNPLQALLGQGQSAANTLTGAAGQMGQNLMQGYGNLGQARASAYVGGTQALQQGLQGLSGAAQMYSTNQMLAPMYAAMAQKMAGTT